MLTSKFYTGFFGEELADVKQVVKIILWHRVQIIQAEMEMEKQCIRV